MSNMCFDSIYIFKFKYNEVLLKFYLNLFNKSRKTLF